MPVRYIAFLRAINVGGHTVRMEELRRLFERMGAAQVQTFIASGNVIFESAAAPDVLELQLEAATREGAGVSRHDLPAHRSGGIRDCAIAGVSGSETTGDGAL